MSEHQSVTNAESNKALWITGIIIAILVVGLITNGFGLFNKKTGSVVENGQYIPLTIGESPVLGNPNAPITIYEFSDFSCPYCAAASGFNQQVMNQLNSRGNWEAPIPAIKEKYLDSGQVKIVFKYASGHGTGKPAHIVGYALADQNPDLFWKFHDLAFANQVDVSSLDKMKDLAESIGADMTALETYIDSNKANFLIQQDLAMANSNGVSGTPTFFINGRVVEGAASFSTFESIIESELSKL